MNKKLAILLTMVGIAVVYLFLLVGVPALEDAMPPCGDIPVANVTVNLTADLRSVGPPLDFRPYREKYKAPLILYLVPGLVGIAFVVVILKQKGGE